MIATWPPPRRYCPPMGRLRSPLLALALAITLATAPAALAVTSEPTESYATLLTQIAAKKGDAERVIAATVDKSDHHVRITLADGSRPLVSYPTADDRLLVDNLLHHKIPVIFTKKKAAVHHTLRYVAGGIVVVLLLIGGGVWFYTRGRPDSGTGADTAAPAAP